MSVEAVEGGRETLERAAAHFPIYRTYVRFGQDGSVEVAEADRAALAAAGIGGELAQTLLAQRPVAPEFPLRFQQTTSPVVAKGIEDTAFYRYGRLLALNDVGGDPERFGLAADAFHAANRDRAQRFPETMLTR